MFEECFDENAVWKDFFWKFYALPIVEIEPKIQTRQQNNDTSLTGLGGLVGYLKSHEHSPISFKLANVLRFNGVSKHWWHSWLVGVDKQYTNNEVAVSDQSGPNKQWEPWTCDHILHSQLHPIKAIWKQRLLPLVQVVVLLLQLSSRRRSWNEQQADKRNSEY